MVAWAAAWSLLLLLLTLPAQALSTTALPLQPPSSHVLDEADLLSRAAMGEIGRALENMTASGIQATWVSIPRLDYGVTLQRFGDELLQRWQIEAAGNDEALEQLLLLVDAQTSGTAIVASATLQGRLTPELLVSTARTTMAQPLRSSGRYRQGSLDALERLQTVLNGGEDPGPPELAEAVQSMPAVRIPTHEQTLSSNALTWVIVLLVVGTVVPMLTWWVFSR